MCSCSKWHIFTFCYIAGKSEDPGFVRVWFPCLPRVISPIEVCSPWVLVPRNNITSFFFILIAFFCLWWWPSGYHHTLFEMAFFTGQVLHFYTGQLSSISGHTSWASCLSLDVSLHFGTCLWHMGILSSLCKESSMLVSIPLGTGDKWSFRWN